MVAKRKIAILGAGASGLTAIKCCLDEGLEPVCFERSDDIGGLWRYTEEVIDDQACVAKSTVINTSKEMMCYSDFPIPKEFPNYMHNTYVMKYFRLYVDKFDLAKHIRFKTTIGSVKKAENYSQTGKWVLELTNLNTNEETNETFDAVLVCTGHHAEKNIPTFPGLEKFKGRVLHSHEYKHVRGYEDKNVLIVGIGNSGGDAAVEISRVSKQVYLSTRRGAWILNRVGQNGVPLDLIFTNRFSDVLRKVVPTPILMSLAEGQVESRFNHEKYSLKPQHRIFQQHPTVNDDLPNRIICGAVQIRPDIKQFTENGVEFDDGTTINDLDVVILATGYKFGFPFLDKDVIEVIENKVNLFKFVWNPDLEHPTMAFIGFFQPLGAINPIAELQCRWAASVFKGDLKLPSKGLMWADIKRKQGEMAERYYNSKRHTIQVDFVSFMDELAEQIGCKPDIWKLFKEDPRLALKCLFGPCMPYQYRLVGRNSWPGAKVAIQTLWERVDAPLKTRPTGNKPTSGTTRFIFQCFLVLIIAYIFKIIFGF
ncbi:unnamed protein product [Owenia fusiformis]|uniref:Flavin-containing monooxygenase n=1 Tax=Owenia fusiformis TaxID=6347 RepID=A0A8J1XVX6_OWEFU|nr:unnamed protein product [Owenia fusiformis]